MALQIIDCIQCDVCQGSCPNGAISSTETGSFIDPELCTECVGYFDAPRCVEDCPVGGISIHPDRLERREERLEKFHAMVSATSH